MTRKMTRRSLLSAAAALAIALGASACGAQNVDEGPDYIDDEAMSIIAQGFQARADTLDKTDIGTTDEEYANYLKGAVQAEIDNDAVLKNSLFEDSKLQEQVLSYVNLLDDSLELLDTYTTSSIEFSEGWSDIYNQRSVLLSTFVSDYGLTVGDKYQSSLDEIIKNGNSVSENAATEEAIETLVASLSFEKIDEGYGYYSYTAIGENTSGIDFNNVGLVLALYDSDGIKAADAYASTSSWLAGEKVKFETSSDVDAQDIKVSVDYYEVAK